MIDSARKEEEKLHQIEQKMLNIKRSYENARCNSIAKNSIMEILNISRSYEDSRGTTRLSRD